MYIHVHCTVPLNNNGSLFGYLVPLVDHLHTNSPCCSRLGGGGEGGGGGRIKHIIGWWVLSGLSARLSPV